MTLPERTQSTTGTIRDHFIEVTTLAQTMPHGERHETMCDCGWRGPVRLFFADALRDAEGHRKEVDVP